MNSDDYLNWCRIENTVTSRLRENSLAYTLKTKKKIRLKTKLINEKFNKSTACKTYKYFLKCKKDILKNLSENVVVTEESDFSNDDYESFYNNFNTSCSKHSDNNTSDWFSWLFIEKKNCNGNKSENNGNRSSSCELSIGTRSNNKKSEYQTDHSSSTSYSNDNTNFNVVDVSTNIVNIIKSKVTNKSNKHSSVEKNKSLSPKKFIKTKHSKYMKRNSTPVINNAGSKMSESSNDDWNDDFIPSDFQAHSTKIFSNTINEVNQKKTRSYNNKSRLSQIDTINQPRDSGIEEDSREDNVRHEIVDNKSTYATIKKIKTTKHDNNINENDKKYSNFENIIEENVSDKMEDINVLNNLIEKEEKNIDKTDNKKIQLKIIGEEKVIKKYKIINNRNAELEQEEQNINSKFGKVNNNNFLSDKIKCNNESSADNFDSLINIGKSNKTINEYYNLDNNSNQTDLSDNEHLETKQNSSLDLNNELDIENYTNKEQKKYKNKFKKKLKNSKSLYSVHQYNELKQSKVRSNSEEDSDYIPDTAELKNNGKNSIQDDKTVVLDSILQSSDPKEDNFNFVHDDQHLSDNSDQGNDKKLKYKKEKNNIVSLDKKQNFQPIKESVILENNKTSDNSDSNEKVKQNMRTSINESVDINKYEENCKKEKNSLSSNMSKYLQTNKNVFVNTKLNKNKNDVNVILNNASSEMLEESEINIANTKIKNTIVLSSCSLLDEMEIQCNHHNSVENCENPNFINLNTNKNEDTLSLNTDKYFVKMKKLDLLDQNKMKNKKDNLSSEERENLNFSNYSNLSSDKEQCEMKDTFGSVENNEKQNNEIIEMYAFASSDKKSNKFSDNNIKNSYHINIDTKKQNTLKPNKFIEHNMKNIDESNLSNDKIHKSTPKTLKNVISDNNKAASTESLDIDVIQYSSHNEVDNDKKTINDNPEKNKKDLDVDAMSPSAYKRFKYLKRLNLCEESEQLQSNFENIKSTNNQINDEQVQESNINTLSSGVNEQSKLLENVYLHKNVKENFNEENSIKWIQNINVKDSNESDTDEESDAVISTLALQKLSQFKKMNLLNNDSSSSENEQPTVMNKSLINNLTQKSENSEKQISLEVDKADLVKFDTSDFNSFKNKDSFTNKSLSTESLKQNNKIAKPTSIEVSITKDTNDLKQTDVKVNDNIEDLNITDLDENCKNNTIINETQESIDIKQDISESQEIFSALDNLTEKLNLDQINENEKSESDIRRLEMVEQISSTPKLKEIKNTNKKIKISELIEKENLTECSYGSTMVLNDISADEEIFILDISKNAFNENLVGKKLFFSQKILQLGNNKYEALQKRYSSTFTCVLKSKKNFKNLFKILNIRPVMSIVTRRNKNFINLNKNTDIENKGKISTHDESTTKLLTNTNKNEKKTKEIKLNASKTIKKKNVSNSSMKTKNEDKISKNVISIREKKLKRKLDTTFDDNDFKNKQLRYEFDSNLSDESSPQIRKLKTGMKRQKNADLNEDIYQKMIKNESKLKNSTSEYEKNFVKKFNKNNIINTIKRKRVKNDSNEDSNLDVEIEEKPKMKHTSTKESNFVGKRRKVKKNKIFTEKKFKNEIVKSAIEQIINIVKKNVKFNEENDEASDFSTENCKYAVRDTNHGAIKKKKTCALSSSDENDRKYIKRSFQVMDNSKLQKSKKSLKCKESQSGFFIVNDVQNVKKKIYFDE